MNKDFLNLISKDDLSKENFENDSIYELYNLIHNSHNEDEDISLGLIEDKKYIDTDKDNNRYYHYDFKDTFEAVYLNSKYEGGKLNAIFMFDQNICLTDDIKIGNDFNLELLKDEFSDLEYEVINDEMFSVKLEEGILNIVSLNNKINEFEFYYNIYK